MRRLLIVDDHPGFRIAVRTMLERDGFRVVGEAADGPAAAASVRLHEPDLVLLDVHLPGEDGFAVCEQLLEISHGLAIVLTSSHDATLFRRRLRSSQARGFISKQDLTAASLNVLLET
jgi:two-component system nitrate/nitrite response regulator NarL